MDVYLATLAQAILSTDKAGISKVRFAKLIYLLHKQLVQEGKQEGARLSFQRLPLGPVPVGFFKLAKSLASNEIQMSMSAYGLSYDAEVYKLRSFGTNSLFYENEARELAGLTHRQGTSALVDYTHEEPGWLSHANGDTYFISSADLKRKIKFSSKAVQDKAQEISAMQANLVAGMIDDIVEESTSLEYPQSEK